MDIKFRKCHKKNRQLLDSAAMHETMMEQRLFTANVTASLNKAAPIIPSTPRLPGDYCKRTKRCMHGNYAHVLSLEVTGLFVKDPELRNMVGFQLASILRPLKERSTPRKLRQFLIKSVNKLCISANAMIQS